MRFLGRRSDPEVCYAAADLLVLPSWHDSFCFAVLEAMASGLPVVSTRHAGIQDVVVDAQTGILVPENDGDAMAEGMLEMAANPRKAGELGLAGRRRVFEHFTLGRSIAKLANVLTDASGGRLSVRV